MALDEGTPGTERALVHGTDLLSGLRIDYSDQDEPVLIRPDLKR
jgi:hypothetical protein